MASRCTLAGVEVPIIGSDSIKWIDLSLPSSSSSTAIAITDSDANLDVHSTCAPLTDDFASCSAIGDPPTYVIWSLSSDFCFGGSYFDGICCERYGVVYFEVFVYCRRIRKSLPNALELLELSADKEFPRIGLRIAFPDSLSVSAFVCKNEVPLTVSLVLMFLEIFCLEKLNK